MLNTNHFHKWVLFSISLLGGGLLLSMSVSVQHPKSEVYAQPITPIFEPASAVLNERVQQCELPCWGNWQLGITPANIILNDELWAHSQYFRINTDTQVADAQIYKTVFYTGNLALEPETAQEELPGLVQTYIDVYVAGSPQPTWVAFLIAMDTPSFDEVDWSAYYPATILETLGKPDEIGVTIWNSKSVEITFYYESLGIMAHYALVDENEIIDAQGLADLCNASTTIFQLRIWLEAESFEPTDFWDDYSYRIKDKIDERRRLGQDIETMLGMTVDEFVQQFQVEDGCVNN